MAETISGPERERRRKRVQRIKKMIVCVCLIAIFLPMVFSIILFVRVIGVFHRTDAMLEQIIAAGVASESAGEGTEQASIYVSAQVAESTRVKTGGQAVGDTLTEDAVKIYLTFDDGPSSNTNAILDVLKEYNVKATFFVVGKTDEQSKRAYRRIVDEGHTLGMHSYSHKYQEIYQSLESFCDDLSQLQEYLYEETGIWCRYCRFPGGSSNSVSQIDMNELIAYLEDSNITYFDWNIASGDAVSGMTGARRLAENCIAGVNDKRVGIVLLHDAADKGSTVEALPLIIEGIRGMGNTELLPITDDTVPIQHLVDRANDK